MGISWSNNNSRRRNNHHPYPLLPPPPPPNPYYYPPPPPPPPPHGYYYNSTNPQSYYYSSSSSSSSSDHPFYPNQHHQGGWSSFTPPICTGTVSAPPPPPPYVDHQTAKKIKNNVNLHKDTLTLQLDPLNPNHHLLSFVFDALFHGSITIFYLAKEEEQCRFIPLYPDAFEPITFPFEKGAGQKFCQPSGTGIDLGFFELDDLSKPSPREDVFPLVICAETRAGTPSPDENPSGSMLDSSPRMQITQAVLEKSNGSGPFQVKVVKQILWIDNVRYELRELYGIGGSAATDFDDTDPGKECVICMTEPKDTAVLPCRHMCMCSECAKALRLQSNKCPICRQAIEELIEIKISKGDQ
ncbi:hypothetical protein TanjilG_27310 [Lupinus angustifolius]|uniref:RING-type E3 ubiquitin transferase n=1 Tax=Lupinus angustifolius TaxID=3871 RepID=A0A1J7I3X6_LUPAN|nr:PREDICTED: probable E3 ubiquitin-protein ligase LUL4 isoform X1 [Lupinus angustifolius]OIW19771.1 hypothetical protein TanjilG_27310 [Lupinus angustifolius]